MQYKMIGILICTLMLILSTIPVFKLDFNVRGNIISSELTSEKKSISDSSISIKKTHHKLNNDYEKHIDIQDSIENPRSKVEPQTSNFKLKVYFSRPLGSLAQDAKDAKII